MTIAPLTDGHGIAARARAVLPGGLIGRSGLPADIAFIPASGAGACVFDADGRGYVDYLAGAGALILGHAPQPVVEAIAQQAAKGAIFFGLPSEPAIALAEEIVRICPRADKALLTTTGSEATQYAMRLARAFSGKEAVLKFEGAYHGNHDFVQVSTSSAARANEARGNLDSLGVPQAVTGSMLIAPFNDTEALRAIVRENKDTLAAIIVDPMPRGGIFPLPGFIQSIRTIADEFGILLIFDEVLTGFRLAYGGAQEYFGVEADLVSYGKIIGGGLPLGAVAGPAAILDLADTTRKHDAGHVLINGTMHGAPLPAAAGLATLAQLRTPDFYTRLNEWAAHLRRKVAAVVQRHAIPAIVDGDASYWHMAFAGRPHRNLTDSLAADYKAIVRFDTELVRNGLYLLPGGRRLTTSAHGDAEMETTLRAVDAACRAVR